MYKLLSFILIVSFALNNIVAAKSKGLLTYKSEYSVTDTVARLTSTLDKKQFKIFNHIDHSAGAQNNNISLRDTQLIIFGNPKIGSRLMQCTQSSAIDLPQKALIWKDKNGLVWLAFNDPAYIQQRHQLKSCAELITIITGALSKIAIEVTQKGSEK